MEESVTAVALKHRYTPEGSTTPVSCGATACQFGVYGLSDGSRAPGCGACGVALTGDFTSVFDPDEPRFCGAGVHDNFKIAAAKAIVAANMPSTRRIFELMTIGRKNALRMILDYADRSPEEL